jgi:hypothetical protein
VTYGERRTAWRRQWRSAARLGAAPPSTSASCATKRAEQERIAEAREAWEHALGTEHPVACTEAQAGLERLSDRG